ncbi:SurA N-terminal domain-containing protein [Tahibacter soli]|uniref:Periplasmic chaperone PpiD n=1 Tax=Tahibacter soli TaxID=2983605 RepID=A0A9X4BMJ2_9GAMM|nr:SurA N-terminal domain-containing protein [Tahibacter soli]MDC8015374.1 SurA N-terminal domain-containing protein [Tahibacter soli]
MLQALREKTSGLIAKIVLGALIFVFSFFGIESYFQAQNQTWLAKVGKNEITQEAFTERLNRERQNMLSRMGGQGDVSIFERPETKRAILRQMIDEELWVVANEKYGINVTDKQLRDTIAAVPQFQTDGKFDPAVYKSLLIAIRKTADQYESETRRDMAWRVLPIQLNSLGTVTPRDIDAFIKLRDQTRDLRQLTLAKPAAESVKIEDAAIETYYKQNSAQYMTPELVSLDYVEIDGAALKLDVAPDEATLRARYEKEKARFVTPEQRLASHILVQAKGSDADAQKKALAKAQELAAQIKGGKAFADVAKQNSEDLGSKAQGGDLGWLEKGVTDPAFEQVLFSLKKGDISDPILSGEGYHLVELRDVREQKEKSFDEVKEELGKDLLESERERRVSEETGKAIDAAQSDLTSLEPAAKAIGSTVKKTELFSRQGGAGIAANPDVLKAAFSDSVRVEGANSDAIDIGGDKKVLIRLAEHKPSEARPLDSVREEIRAKLVAESLAKQAKEQADALLDRLNKGETLDAIATELKLKASESKGTGRRAANLDSALVTAAFKLPRPAEGKPAYASVALADGAYALVAVDAVHEGDVSKVDEAGRTAVLSQLQNEAGLSGVLQFLESMRQEIRVEIADERLTSQ